MLWTAAIISIVVVIAIGSITTCIGGGVQKKEQHPVKTTVKEKQQTENVHVVSASQLVSDYKENEVTADNKWKGKYVVMDNAIIRSIQKDVFGTAYVIIDPRGRFDFVHARFNDDRFKSHVLQLKAGQTASIAGRVTGMTLGSVMLDEAQVVPGR